MTCGPCTGTLPGLGRLSYDRGHRLRWLGTILNGKMLYPLSRISVSFLTSSQHPNHVVALASAKSCSSIFSFSNLPRPSDRWGLTVQHGLSAPILLGGFRANRLFVYVAYPANRLMAALHPRFELKSTSCISGQNNRFIHVEKVYML